MYTYNAKATKVIDGDLIEVEIDLGFGVWISHRIKLKGITVPESRSIDKQIREYGQAAKKRLEELICFKPSFNKSEVFEIETYRFEKDKFGRTLGIIYADGVNLNWLLKQENHAIEYASGPRPDWRKIKGITE